MLCSTWRSTSTVRPGSITRSSSSGVITAFRKREGPDLVLQIDVAPQAGLAHVVARASANKLFLLQHEFIVIQHIHHYSSLLVTIMLNNDWTNTICEITAPLKQFCRRTLQRPYSLFSSASAATYGWETRALPIRRKRRRPMRTRRQKRNLQALLGVFFAAPSASADGFLCSEFLKHVGLHSCE